MDILKRKHEVSVSIVVYENDKNLLLRVVSCVLESQLLTSLYIIYNYSTNNLREILPQYNSLEYIFINSNN